MFLPVFALLSLCSLCLGDPLPDFAIDYAPLLWLHSKETHWPSDVKIHLQHVTPMLHGNQSLAKSVPTLTGATLNHAHLNSPDVYLTAKDDPTDSIQASWLTSEYGKPDVNGKSAAPVLCVVVDKEGVRGQDPVGDADVFYFTFFSFSAGLDVPMFKKTMGSHVGDWEHSMIRFRDGKPQAVYVSRHGGGSAFSFDMVPKEGKRPILYIAKGSHATYVQPGEIDFANSGMVYDETERGVLLDPTLNLAGFFHRPDTDAYEQADNNDIPIPVLTSQIKWGDKHLPTKDKRQAQHGGFYKWADGPQGPAFKTLVRYSMGPKKGQNLEKTLPTAPPPGSKHKKPQPNFAKIRAEEKARQSSATASSLKQAAASASKEAARSADLVEKDSRTGPVIDDAQSADAVRKQADGHSLGEL